jgi:hemoglobin/transferrin/lactoferrin receptor protein
MKVVFLLLFLSFYAGLAKAQIITVLNKNDNTPIVGATLNSKSEVSAVTNSKGQVDIADFKGEAEIQFRSLGFETEFLTYNDIIKSDLTVYLTPSNLSLDEVVISGTRWRQTSANIPAKIISISPNEVAMLNPQTAADMLALSGKVFIQKSQQGGGSPMIRGFATNRLLYAVDGVRMNNAIFRGGNIQNVINLDPFATEKTEVLFGPGSVIYGSDAIGGVMSFQTLRPQLSINDDVFITGKALTRFSSANNEKTGHFDVSVGWKKLALVSSFSYWDYDHLKQGKNGPVDYLKPYYVERNNGIDEIIEQENELLQIPTAYSQFNTMQKLRFKPNSKWDINYGFHYSQTSNYGRYDRHNRMRDDLPRYAEWNYGPQKWLMHNLSANYLAKNKLFDEMAIRLAFQNFEESRIDRSLNSDVRSKQVEEVDALSANLDFEKHTALRNTVYYGFEFVQNNVSSTGAIENIISGNTVGGPSRYPQSNWASVAIYFNDEFKVNEKLAIQVGARYNQYVLNATFDTTFYPFPFTEANLNKGALTGSFGLVYRPNESTAIKSNIGTAFRSPNVDDIGKVFDSEPGAVTVPNPNLQAEYAQNIDLSLAKVFAQKLKVDLSAYYTLLNNAIVRRDYQLNGADSILYFGEWSRVQALQNAAQAQVYGLQLGFELKISDDLNFSTDLNFQKGVEELDDGTTSPSRHAAPFFGQSRFAYKKNKFGVQLSALYQAERSFEQLAFDERRKDEIYAKDENDNNYAPSWYIVNLKTQYTINNVLSINAGIENITNQRYRPYSSGISGAGRNLVVSATVKF